MMMKSYVMTRTFDFLCGVGTMFSPKTRGFFHEKGKHNFLAHEKSEIFLQILPKYLVGNCMERFFILASFGSL